MRIYSIDPLLDHRWDDLVARHPDASVFHRRGWLEALQSTYGYEPLILTGSPPGEPLRDGMAFCRVSSWMTGTRLVSLPFADHCQPLLDEGGDLQPYTSWLGAQCDQQKWNYVEFRPLRKTSAGGFGGEPCASFWFHQIDLTAGLDQLFSQLHKNSFRRNICRAEREGLAYEAGRSPKLLDEFYRLMIKTRRRHHLLPQPRSWFCNLIACMGDKVQIRVARKQGKPVAAMLSLEHGSSVVFKYGCSDVRFHRLGAVPLLFWKLIEESKTSGATQIDLGRSDLDHKGLILFKDRLGARKTFLTYHRYTNSASKNSATVLGLLGNWDSIFSMPDAVLSTAGRVVYRHLG
jgi:CelD/BcsL family acetyltransferase involved in cellulose biosynthesis